MDARQGASTYQRIGLETRVMSARPVELVVMLVDGARKALADARGHLREGRVAEKNAAVSKAIDIVEDGLRAGLDMRGGGELAQRLDALYTYIGEQLLRGNLRNDDALFAIADRLLDELGSAWRELAMRAHP